MLKKLIKEIINIYFNKLVIILKQDKIKAISKLKVQLLFKRPYFYHKTIEH
jgi:hypothetical protein